MLFVSPPPAKITRRVALPVDMEYPVAMRQTVANQINALGNFIMYARDVLDFGIDFTDWLNANQNTEVTAATWAAATGSPMPPTIGESYLFGGTETCVLVGPGAAGDVYWLDCTLTIAQAQARGENPLRIGERTLVRRITIQVLAG